MRTVLIAGAGASVAEAAFYRPARSKEYPPLDGSFFDRATVLGDKYQAVATERTQLRQALRHDGSFIDPWTATVPITMEQFFADVYYDVANERSASAFEVYLKLQDLYSAVIAQTTNWISDSTRSGNLTRVLRHELEKADGTPLTIITFNQDLLIEAALARIKRTEPWCLYSLYGGVDLKPLYYRNDGRSVGGLFPNHGSLRCHHTSPVRLLKLHGSFNWATRRSTAKPTIDNIFPRKKKEIYVHDARHVQIGPQTMNTGSKSGRNSWYLWPLIVPPIYEKERIVGIDVVREIWSLAAADLREAERVIVLGYSAPESDVLARQLLRRSYARNDSLSEIVVINPDMAVAAKLKQSLACTSLSVYDDIATYLAAT